MRQKKPPKCPHCLAHHTPLGTWCGTGPTEVRLHLPIPPSTNRMYKRTRRGHVTKTSLAATFGGQVLGAVGGRGGALPPGLPYLGPVHITLVVSRPRKAGDLDNYLKVLFDALQGVVFLNDRQVYSLAATLDDSQPDRPGVDLVVTPIVQPAPLTPARRQP